VDDKLFAALDRAMETGGQKVKKVTVVGDATGKVAKALLADLVENKHYFQKDGTAFTMTDEGRAAWEGKASAARKQELRDGPIAAFLEVVVGRKGKALSDKQNTQFADATRQAQADGLVAETGGSKYSILPKGEDFLQTRRPLAEQLEWLRGATQGLLKGPQALFQRLEQETEKLVGSGAARAAFADARTALQGEVARAQADFERALNGLQGYANLMAAAQRFQEALPPAVTQAVARIDAEAERVRKLETELRQTVDQLRAQLAAAHERMERRFAAVEEKVQALPAASPPTPVTVTPTGDGAAPSEQVWEATRRAYDQLERQFKLTSELIKVPNLTDLVRKEVPGLTVAQFHDLLQKWQGEDQLVLQVCNDPHFEPRAAEGIRSSRGLLFYVEMK
jgi:hypothetical protein